ncbi:MAG TPA: DnaJ domain-containing protein [Spirochaetota bacterium]|nr:DnaJ domain-containing protein [Spirochaetota bacterium]
MVFTSKEIYKAVNDIFDSDYNTISNDFIKNIHPESLKSAYRKRVKQFHPDRAKIIGVSESILTEKFKSISNSYQFLLSVVKESEKLQFIQKSNYQNAQNNCYKKKDEYKEPHKKEENLKPKYNYNKYKVKSFYCSTGIPNRKLRLSEFLFYSKLIDWHTMIRSIVWQFQVRPRFGEIAISYNFLTDEHVNFILKNLRMNEKFGEAAMRLGFIDLFKTNVILGKQKFYNNPIGKYFIENGILNQEKLTGILESLRRHNLKCV